MAGIAASPGRRDELSKAKPRRLGTRAPRNKGRPAVLEWAAGKLSAKCSAQPAGYGLIPIRIAVIPAEPRERREPESITPACVHGFRVPSLRSGPGKTSQTLCGLV